MNVQNRARTKRSGRREKLTKRKAAPEVNPAPPGQLGGAYKPLSAPDLQNIYDTALRLLEKLGMGEVADALGKGFTGCGRA